LLVLYLRAGERDFSTIDNGNVVSNDVLGMNIRIKSERLSTMPWSPRDITSVSASFFRWGQIPHPRFSGNVLFRSPSLLHFISHHLARKVLN
jgi:hypothetical protein